MAQYDKYICTDLHKRDMLPGPTPAQREQLAAEGRRISLEHVLWIDNDIIPGAYYGETVWIWPQSFPHQISPQELSKRFADAKPMFPHVHDFPEILSWYGTDPDHPEDTTTKGLLLDDEEITLETSWVAYVPAGMTHMPTKIPGGKVTSRPIYHFTSGPGSYTREAGHDAPPPPEKKGPLPAEIKKSGILKNKQYIVTGVKPGVKRPSYMCDNNSRYRRPVAYIDETVVPGAEFGCDTMWLLPGEHSRTGQMLMEPHTLPHGTSITLAAMNYEDMTDLRAEAELWIGGEKHIINKCFGAYIPPGVEQGPLIIRNIDKQIFFMVSQPVGEGVKKYRGK
jgi:hypothetical protein